MSLARAREFERVILKSAAPPEPLFQRGDVDGDGRVGFPDALAILDELFDRGRSIGCEDAADIDDNGAIDLADAAALIAFHLAGGAAPQPPFEGCGPDPSKDGLGCERADACGGESVSVSGEGSMSDGLAGTDER